MSVLPPLQTSSSRFSENTRDFPLSGYVTKTTNEYQTLKKSMYLSNCENNGSFIHVTELITKVKLVPVIASSNISDVRFLQGLVVLCLNVLHSTSALD